MASDSMTVTIGPVQVAHRWNLYHQDGHLFLKFDFDKSLVGLGETSSSRTVDLSNPGCQPVLDEFKPYDQSYALYVRAEACHRGSGCVGKARSVTVDAHYHYRLRGEVNIGPIPIGGGVQLKEGEHQIMAGNYSFDIPGVHCSPRAPEGPPPRDGPPPRKGRPLQ